MDISDNACEFIKQETATFNYDPAVMIIERIFQGWCGQSKAVTASLVDRKMLLNESEYIIKNGSQCLVPIWIEKNLQYLVDKSIIDVAGWLTFRRLIVIPTYSPWYDAILKT